MWKSDGTSSGTLLVKDITPGADGTTLAYLTDVNGMLYFTAYGNINGKEPWKSAGTASGTTLVKDIRTGTTFGAGPGSLTRCLLDAVESNDQIRYRIGEAEGLRVESLQLHETTHTPINRAEMTAPVAEGPIWELAEDVVVGSFTIPGTSGENDCCLDELARVAPNDEAEDDESD